LSFRVFLSAVTSEFGPARSALASDLRARGLEVKEQKDFRQEQDADTTLRLLEQYIRGCDAVVAIMGRSSGSLPPLAAAEPFRRMLPPGIEEASYTQWEIHCARWYRRRLSFYVAAPDWPVSDPYRPELQAALRHHLFEQEGLNRTEGFDSADALCRQVLREDWPDYRVGKPVHPRFRSIGTLFKGRAEAITALRRALVDSLKPVALWGMGGIGKTRLAIEYGLTHAAGYAALLFASGESAEALDASLAGLSTVLRCLPGCKRTRIGCSCWTTSTRRTRSKRRRPDWRRSPADT